MINAFCYAGVGKNCLQMVHDGDVIETGQRDVGKSVVSEMLRL